MNPKIPADLTFEQFKALADRRPDLSGAAVYRLEHAVKDSGAAYPQFDIDIYEYFFLSLDDAESHMREKLVNGEYADNTYRFVITRIPIGVNSWHMNAVWVYSKEGALVDHCSYLRDVNGDAMFLGRGESRIRFHKGDIVEVVGRDEVTLAVVAAEGPTVEWFWGLYGRSKDKYGYPADDTDDCYYVLDGLGYAYHSHPSPLSLMPLSMPIDDDIKAYFEHCLECADVEDCRDKWQTEFFSLHDLDSVGETRIKIVYDIGAQCHRLQLVSDFANDEAVETTLTAETSPQLLQSTSQWLAGVMYGRSRLWYLIRKYNENRNEDVEPALSPFSTFNQLMANGRRKE